jgi:flavin-dependent dehydrogenase
MGHAMRGRSFDIAIVGGGPAGSALALSLSILGWQVVLIERTRYDDTRIGESIPPACAARVRRLGVWDAFMALDPLPSHGVRSVWGSAELQSTSFLGHPETLGWQVDRARLDSMLSRAAESAGAQRRMATRVSRVMRADGQAPDNGWQLHVEESGVPARIDARYLVDATGRGARVALEIGARRRRVDSLVGIALAFTPASAEPVEPRPTMVEAAEQGWWYTTSVPGARELAVFLTDADVCSARRLTDRAVFLELLEHAPHSRERLYSWRAASAPRAFPAASHVLTAAAGVNWLAVGDAAVARDPLSSSGVDFALASAELARRALLDADRTRDHTTWVDYDAAIQRDFAAYTALRSFYYAQEQRWSDATFWRRRHRAT